MHVLRTDGSNPPIKLWGIPDQVEDAAMAQLRNIARLPYIFRHVAAMPDVHLGKGATVGSVIASKGAISPSAVGVDIGCGMLAAPLGMKIETVDALGLKAVRHAIENAVPVGHNGHKSIQDLGTVLMSTASERVRSVWQKSAYQIGTLGGGNHFIEISADEKGDAWLMLHSGSRNVGKEVAEIHIRKAKEIARVWMIQLEDPDLAWLAENTTEFREYLADLEWCQRYAYMNRQHMLSNIFSCLGLPIPEHGRVVNCHHNYVATENHFGENVFVTRKGAVRARVGDLGIIPGSMGQKSYIVTGKGNPESFCSCSHGAGRKHSRTAAKKLFTVADLEAQTAGVECRKDIGILDEIPSAYKDIDQVMENQSDLIEVVHSLKAIVCIKG